MNFVVIPLDGYKNDSYEVARDILTTWLESRSTASPGRENAEISSGTFNAHYFLLQQLWCSWNNARWSTEMSMYSTQ